MAIEPAGPEQIVFRGSLIEIVHQDYVLPSGRKTFETARRGPGTRIIVRRRDEILITEEYRVEVERIDFRVPGGKVFDSLEEYEYAIKAGADLTALAKAAAARELHEETGFQAEDLHPFAVSKCGATITWDLHYFICTEGTFEPSRTDRDIDEEISVRWRPIPEVHQMCLDGRISEERSAIQILRYLTAEEAIK